jgi:hypothetical protein
MRGFGRAVLIAALSVVVFREPDCVNLNIAGVAVVLKLQDVT